MEILKYVIEDDKIAELLGVQNFTNKESAILEVVKNAYDAGATTLELNFKNDCIAIVDNGVGMSYDVLKTRWTKVGSSVKEYEFYDINHQKRVFSGSKGIGRFALARLGKKVEIISKMRNCDGVKWFTNWSETYIEKNDANIIGTSIKITSLRDTWTKKTIEKLAHYLSTVYNDDLMKITLVYENENVGVVEKRFIKPKLGVNCLSIIKIDYDSKTKALQCDVTQDEFLDEAQKYCENINIYEYKSILNMSNEVFDDLDVSDSRKNKLLEELGSFYAELYFAFKPIKDDCNRFLYKYQNLVDPYNDGIILYRNAFSISSYEGKKDWLELGKRLRKSPAAATHPTGSWRVRENQISGKVVIDKIINKNLNDLSNRQGFDENEYYNIFVQIICKGITEFERYRQSIIRRINTKNTIAEKKTTLIDSFVSKPLNVKKYEEDKIKNLAFEVVELKKENEEHKRSIGVEEQKHRYDTRILNTLSTIGLKAASIAHEVHTDRDNMAFSTEILLPRLKELGVWNILDDKNNKKNACDDVPSMLEANDSIIKKITSFMDVMLTNIEKKNFNPQILNIREVLTEIKKNWEFDYNWITIELDVDDTINFFTSVDVINVIFDNLILNSVQQNDSARKLKIIAKIIKNGQFLIVDYNDNGVGLNAKYLSDPRRILEVHESSRKDGHGLGMWIINNTLKITGGDIDRIDGHNGFSIRFSIGSNI